MWWEQGKGQTHRLHGFCSGKRSAVPCVGPGGHPFLSGLGAAVPRPATHRAGPRTAQLLDGLLASGFLLDEMMVPGGVQPPGRAPLSRASWMGLCGTGASPWARRIDVKVRGSAIMMLGSGGTRSEVQRGCVAVAGSGAWGMRGGSGSRQCCTSRCATLSSTPTTSLLTPPKRISVRSRPQVYAREHLPFAVNYFANSQSFCRATRHWATQAAQQARECTGDQSATGFKLSDKDVCLLLPEGAPSSCRVPCASETDLFRLLGLDYVPVTMRYFNKYF